MLPRISKDEHSFVRAVARRGGFGTEREAYPAIRATLGALGEGLRDSDRHLIGDALPPRFAGMLRSHDYRGALDAPHLYERVSRRERVPIGHACEHAQVVCRAVGERLPPDARSALAETLSPSVAELLASPLPTESATRPVAVERIPRPEVHEHHTLATGKPGSRHPVSEAHPKGGQAHSVAESNPHGETKLSSATGLTQERLDESLATGHPDTKRSIGEAGD